MRTLALPLALGCLWACNDTTVMRAPTGFATDDGGSAHDAGDGTDTPEGCIVERTFEVPDGYPAFAVVNTDRTYTTSSIALLDANGALLEAEYLGASSTIEGLPMGLGGDVTLPTTPGDPRVLSVVGRYQLDYVLRVDLDTGNVLRRIATQQDPFVDNAAAWSSNPGDVLYVNETTALVSRLEPNLDPDAPDIDRGDDLLVLDPSTGESRDRVDLSAFVETVTTDDGRTTTVFARPGSLVGMGCHAAFGTSRIDGAFETYGEPGSVGVLDLRALEATRVDIEGLQNCGKVAPVPGDDSRVLVQCQGVWSNTATAGLALVHVDGDGAAIVEHTYRPTADEPGLSTAAVSLGGVRALAVRPGQPGSDNDVAYVVNLEKGTKKKLFEGTGGFTLGSGTYDANQDRLYVPDADVGIRVFEPEGDSFVERDPVVIDARLSAREIRPLR